MKLSAVLYRELVEGLREAVDATGGVEKIQEHREALMQQPRYQLGGGGDIEQRIRWDVYRVWERMSRPAPNIFVPFSGSWMGRAYVEGCNDEHVDTALRKAQRELNF